MSLYNSSQTNRGREAKSLVVSMNRRSIDGASTYTSRHSWVEDWVWNCNMYALEMVSCSHITGTLESICRRRDRPTADPNKAQHPNGLSVAYTRLPVRGLVGLPLLRPWLTTPWHEQWWDWWVWRNIVPSRFRNWRNDIGWWDQCNHCEATSPWCQASCYHWCLPQRNCSWSTIRVQGE